MATKHDIRVVVLVTADEYIATQSMADDDGLSDSAFIRYLIKQEAKKRAIAKLSEEQRLRAMEEPAQVVHNKWVAA